MWFDWRTDMEGYRHSIRILVAMLAILFLMVGGTLVACAQEGEENESGQESSEEPSSESQSENEDSEEDPGEESEEAASDRPSQDSPLVAASKNRLKKDEGGKSKFLTNEDAENSRGNIVEIESSPELAANLITVAPEPEGDTASGRTAALEKVKRNYEEALSEREQEISKLKEEVRTLEETFYVEQDPALRDKINERFATAQKEIEEKTKRLLEFRSQYQEFMKEYKKQTAQW